ncbi:hypothetical protein KJB62_10780 [Staphylococcus saprophyticus]|uniref:hypothetical protein n=1 Tax=Staphylococcus saprophyticus TaxID=29385 RepID=UPI001F372BC9|nr:hypothetical protein [Staphylococcus saprophyticus]MCE5131875.1 hypothetical protein [Staphylococcus saprophyticus]
MIYVINYKNNYHLDGIRSCKNIAVFDDYAYLMEYIKQTDIVKANNEQHGFFIDNPNVKDLNNYTIEIYDEEEGNLINTHAYNDLLNIPKEVNSQRKASETPYVLTYKENKLDDTSISKNIIAFNNLDNLREYIKQTNIVEINGFLTTNSKVEHLDNYTVEVYNGKEGFKLATLRDVLKAK